MKSLRSNYFLLIILTTLVALQACKAKKAIQKPATTADVATPPLPVRQPTPPPPAPTPPPVAAPMPPNYNFSNIQFEFDSGILKTESYPILDKAAAEMKKNPTAKFMLNGYASTEGTDEHNMTLSADRANSVKLYLVNTGVSADNLSTKGNGENNPVANNTTEAGRILNRRVEIKKQN